MRRHARKDAGQAKAEEFEQSWNESRKKIVERKTAGGMQRDAKHEKKWGRK